MRGLIFVSKTSEKGEAKLLDSATVNIYTIERKYLVTFNSTKKGKCEFRLPLNSKFIVEVTRAGMVTKYLEVNTTVPKEKRAAFIFPFTIDIFADIKGLDVSILKKPIAKVGYSYTNDHFNYDYTYTDRINNDLKKMYKDFYFIQTLDEEIGGDSLKPKQKQTSHQPQNKKGN